jgi:hypothetical protein
MVLAVACISLPCVSVAAVSGFCFSADVYYFRSLLFCLFGLQVVSCFEPTCIALL